MSPDHERATVGRPVRRRRMARLAAQALVLTLVVGATSAFAVLHKNVTIDVDGKPRQVLAFGRTVGDVLASTRVQVGDRDLVAPGLDQTIDRGGQIVVRHGHEMSVEVDGEARTVWTTALTVGEAVDGLGLRGGEVRLSASRSASLGRDMLRVSTLKTIHLVVDGQVIDGVSSADTVRDALRDIGLVLEEGDQVSVPLGATAVDGLVVLVTRASTGGETVTEAMPFETEEVEDAGLVKGNRVITTKGKAGVRTTTYELQVVGGVVVGRTPVASIVTTAPVTQVVKVGTAELPNPSVVAVEPGSAQEIGKQLAAQRGWGDDQFACLLDLWNQESGWRVNAENKSSGAYGIPQALPGSKMATVGADWQTNPATQITWGLNYIGGRYGDPCGAWAHHESSGWY
ncbi:ubiquitin-like domain-containing protein [Cellulomonas chitinilytica]|uniref:aggregation-promoting factor C-terminal-like domain-containing protein n=1 Tax=Cellulomonas chitinilytica TaxID=398759 RepID=UPI001EF36591|nr:ubiquitin-like domain-containing protein [Cellulomonas chitinilytica]